MRIITFNLNGIRSAAAKGFFAWVKEQNADVICLQELKATEDVITAKNHLFALDNYHCAYHYAEKKGYSGVAIYSRLKPNHIKVGLGWESADQEGRYVEMHFDNCVIASLYMPSGTSGEHRQIVKYDFMERFTQHLHQVMRHPLPHIICGDFNIAHKPIDLRNWRANQKNTGFLPEERAWLDHVFDELGYVDAFRAINPAPDQYTWWSNRGRAREKMWGGESITMWSHQPLNLSSKAHIFLKRFSFPTMHHSSWIMICRVIKPHTHNFIPKPRRYHSPGSKT